MHISVPALRRIFAAMVLVIFGLDHGAQAQERFAASGEVYTLSVPMPGFHRQGGAEVSRQAGTGPSGQHFVVDELIPRGESWNDWSSLFAIKIEEGLGLNMEQYITQLLAVYVSTCTGMIDGLFVPMDIREELAVFIIPCPSYKDSPDTGEVAVFVIFHRGDSFLNVYQHWRGPAFEGREGAGWPVSADALKLFLANAREVEISPR